MSKPKLTVRQIKLDRGGYGRYGKYYGIGAPVYEALFDTGEFAELPYHTEFRASDRKSALAYARNYFSTKYPNLAAALKK